MTYPLPDFENKICPPEAIASRLAALPRPLVFTNGCFDILHRGHVTYLARPACARRRHGRRAEYRRIGQGQGKGDDRPVNRLAERAAVMAALECVDLVTWFDADRAAADLILAVRPDVLVKGGDWTIENIVGSREVLGWGRESPFRFRSCTRLRRRATLAKDPPGRRLPMKANQNLIGEFTANCLNMASLRPEMPRKPR